MASISLIIVLFALLVGIGIRGSVQAVITIILGIAAIVALVIGA